MAPVVSRQTTDANVVCDSELQTARNPLILKRRDVGVVDRAHLEIGPTCLAGVWVVVTQSRPVGSIDDPGQPHSHPERGGPSLLS
jgi:hypothetical protein